LAGKIALLCGPSLHLQVAGVYQPITGLYFTWYIRPRNFAKRQWLTPPSYRVYFNTLLRAERAIDDLLADELSFSLHWKTRRDSVFSSLP